MTMRKPFLKACYRFLKAVLPQLGCPWRLPGGFSRVSRDSYRQCAIPRECLQRCPAPPILDESGLSSGKTWDQSLLVSNCRVGTFRLVE